MARLCIITHATFEGPATIADWAAARGHEVVRVCAQREPVAAAMQAADALVLMGGPMGVMDRDELPWLQEEINALAAEIHRGKPVLGVCLGAQLLAHVLGADVARNKGREIGWYPVQWHAAQGRAVYPSVDWPSEPLVAYHWHGDRFALPVGAVLLASSDACDHQAFAADAGRLLGLQCHMEMTPCAVKRIGDAVPEDLTPRGEHCRIQPLDEMLQATPETYARMNRFLCTLLDAWLARGVLAA